MWVGFLITLSEIFFLLLLFPLCYLLLLALAGIRSAPKPATKDLSLTNRFMIVIPAHDEVSVIKNTVIRLGALDYPAELFSIHIIADHCSDKTAEVARHAGAIVHERNEGPRSGKGAALTWFFQKQLNTKLCDAVVIFDADTRVEPQFLRVMDWHLSRGSQAIQGQHIIRNPESGWFPALTWAMFLIDNRFQNLGRTNLGWSAKNMGDSICFRADVLLQLGWGEGLTEDYHLRHKLILNGINILYEPAAIGYGEAPTTWTQAQTQRARWLRGTRDTSKQFARELLVEGLKQRKLSIVDGALQTFFPSYSTLTLLSLFGLSAQIVMAMVVKTSDMRHLFVAWGTMVGVLLIYPIFGLILDHAPPRAYIAILLGPYFIFWRTWLAITSRFGRKQVTWIRTEHGKLD